LMTLPWLPFGDSADTIGAGVEIGGTIVFMVLRHSLMYLPMDNGPFVCRHAQIEAMLPHVAGWGADNARD
jgi:hypothetical protein